MKLAELAQKPQLIEITIDDEETIQEFGEAITFWTWDRQPMDVFLKLAAIDHSNGASIIDAVKHLVLDENAQPVLTDGNALPTRIMMRVIVRVVEGLGKS